MDLQSDFLAAEGARMPVAPADAARVIAAANAVLDGQVLGRALPVFVVNRFPRSARLGNFFRRQAAIAGSRGAELDARLHARPDIRVLAKASASAFSNPELDEVLALNRVRQLVILGVFAEGCVRATVADARRRGFAVTVPVDAIGTDSPLKRRYALWAMRRAGATLVPSLHNAQDGL